MEVEELQAEEAAEEGQRVAHEEMVPDLSPAEEQRPNQSTSINLRMAALKGELDKLQKPNIRIPALPPSGSVRFSIHSKRLKEDMEKALGQGDYYYC